MGSSVVTLTEGWLKVLQDFGWRTSVSMVDTQFDVLNPSIRLVSGILARRQRDIGMIARTIYYNGVREEETVRAFKEAGRYSRSKSGNQIFHALKRGASSYAQRPHKP